MLSTATERLREYLKNEDFRVSSDASSTSFSAVYWSGAGATGTVRIDSIHRTIQSFDNRTIQLARDVVSISGITVSDQTFGAAEWASKGFAYVSHPSLTIARPTYNLRSTL